MKQLAAKVSQTTTELSKKEEELNDREAELAQKEAEIHAVREELNQKDFSLRKAQIDLQVLTVALLRSVSHENYHQLHDYIKDNEDAHVFFKTNKFIGGGQVDAAHFSHLECTGSVLWLL